MTWTNLYAHQTYTKLNIPRLVQISPCYSDVGLKIPRPESKEIHAFTDYRSTKSEPLTACGLVILSQHTYFSVSPLAFSWPWAPSISLQGLVERLLFERYPTMRTKTTTAIMGWFASPKLPRPPPRGCWGLSSIGHTRGCRSFFF